MVSMMWLHVTHTMWRIWHSYRKCYTFCGSDTCAITTHLHTYAHLVTVFNFSKSAKSSPRQEIAISTNYSINTLQEVLQDYEYSRTDTRTQTQKICTIQSHIHVLVANLYNSLWIVARSLKKELYPIITSVCNVQSSLISIASWYIPYPQVKLCMGLQIN